MPDQKMTFRHQMLREIHEQPAGVRQTAEMAKNGLWKHLRAISEPAKKADRILIAASGTSRHAGLAGKIWIETLAQMPAEVGYSSEVQHLPQASFAGALVVAITQSGETTDTMAALHRAKSAGAKSLAVCNVEEASVMKEADASIHTKAGPERAIPSTKAFTAQLTALFLFSLWLGKTRGAMQEAGVRARLDELERIPAQMQMMLGMSAQCDALAGKYLWCEDFFFAGRGVHYPIALDGALKLKELSYLHAEGIPTGEILHGPLAVIDEALTIVVIATCDRHEPESMARYENTVANIKEFRSRSGKVIALVNPCDTRVRGAVEDVIEVPDAPELLSPLLEIIPLQLFAYHRAVREGREVDHPRGLSKAVIGDRELKKAR